MNASSQGSQQPGITRLEREVCYPEVVAETNGQVLVFKSAISADAERKKKEEEKATTTFQKQ